MRFLKVRLRSRHEVLKKLEQGGFASGEIDETLQVLEDKKLLDDGRFARWWTEDRALAGKYGPLRVRAELEAKGISKEFIESCLRESYPVKRQKEILKGMALKALGDPGKVAAKALRNGFDEEMVEEILLSSML